MTKEHFPSSAVTKYSFICKKVMKFYPKIPKYREFGLKMEKYPSHNVTLWDF